MRKGDVNDICGSALREKAATTACLSSIDSLCIDIMLSENIESVIPIFFGNHIEGFFRGSVIRYGDTCWGNKINAIGHPVDVFVDPG